MTLVEFRCKVPDCGRLLGAIGDDVPHDVAGTVMFPPCPRHGGLRPRTFASWARRRSGADLEVLIGHRVDLASVRPTIAAARSTGRTQVETL